MTAEPRYCLATAERRLRRDPALRAPIRAHGPCALSPVARVNPLRALLRAIVYQQLSGRAAATIHGRVLALFDRERPLDAANLLATPDRALRAAGLSRAKTLAAKDLAAKVLDGTVPPARRLKTLSDADIVERLTAVRGVGRWTVEMMLIFDLARPDVLPVADLGVRKGYQALFGLAALPDAAGLSAYAERWRPYRSVASWYLWRVAQTPLRS